MAIAMKGLRLKPTYEQLIGVAVSDKLYNIKFPNRDAKFLREGFVLSQLDGEGMRQLEKQQEMASKEAYKEYLLKQIAKNTGANFHDLRNDNHDDLRRERVNNAVYFDISQSDVDMGDDVSSENFGTQTFDAGAQTDDMRPTTRVGITQATSSTDEMGTQTTVSRVKTSNRHTQASSPIVEDRTEEIERLKNEHEAQVQEMQRNNEIKLSNVINQVRAQTTQDIRHQTMAEAEQLHEQVITNKVNEIEFRNAQRMREMQLDYEQKLLNMAQDNDLTKRQAKQIIQQTQAQSRSEAEQFMQYTGRMFDYAEEQHRREQRKTAEANQRAKKAETSAHNAEHKNERTPERNQGKKTKTGPSPKKELPPFPTDERASGSQDKPNYSEPPPESTHEQRGKVGRPKNTQDHDVPYDDNDKVSYWMKQPAEYIRRQAFKRGLDPNSVKRANGKPWTKKEYQAWMKDWLAKEAKKKK